MQLAAVEPGFHVLLKHINTALCLKDDVVFVVSSRSGNWRCFWLLILRSLEIIFLKREIMPGIQNTLKKC